MRINSISIMSRDTLDFELEVNKQITVFCGKHAGLALDLIREVLGDKTAKNDPDSTCDGKFVIHSDIEIDNKNYGICYIRNADFMGDNRIGVNFTPNSIDYSLTDTEEFLKIRDKGIIKTAYNPSDLIISDDNTPIFLYCSDKNELDEAITYLSSCRCQVFIAIESGCATVDCENVRTVNI